MTIVDLKTNPVDQWKQTITNHYPFLPYWWIRRVRTESRQALMNRDLDSALASDETRLLGYISDEGDLLGFAQMHWLEWDTNHFGFETWRLDHLGMWGSSSRQQAIADALVQGVIQTTREQGGQHIPARIPMNNLLAIQALESAGFRTVEALTTLVFDLAKGRISPIRHPDLVRDFEPADTEALVELSRTVYTPLPDRFHMDPRLSPKASDEMYAEWVRNSCSGQLADHIAVAESDGEVVGYITMKYFGDHDGLCNRRIAQWVLGAVSPGFRGLGLIDDLVSHNLEWLKRRQADYCFFGTQGNNIPTQNGAVRLGFKPVSLALTLHYWADD